MNDKLTDEAYARAALTYLSEPADPRLARLLRVHGAAVTLDAIKSGRPLSTPGRAAGPDGQGPGGPGLLPGQEGQGTRAAMEGWRTRLPGLPSREELLAFHEAGIRVICPGDPEWPGQLADLGDTQPYALWLRGKANLRLSCLNSVAVVGTRAATAYGSYVAAELAASVAARGWTVVSGAAFGIDSAAHRGALSAGGATVAVLACGVDTPYPAAHADLLNAIAVQGVIASEWPPGRHVSRLRLLARNRVVAALAAGTVVAEAGRRSGAVSTARHARDLGRRLMAVPGPVTSDSSAGCHQVIREWNGTLVTSAAEVIEHLAPARAQSGPYPVAAGQSGGCPDRAGRST